MHRTAMVEAIALKWFLNWEIKLQSDLVTLKFAIAKPVKDAIQNR